MLTHLNDYQVVIGVCIVCRFSLGDEDDHSGINVSMQEYTLVTVEISVYHRWQVVYMPTCTSICFGLLEMYAYTLTGSVYRDVIFQVS